MTFLLDTHTFLWWITDDKQLSTLARKTMADQNSELLLSVVSLWEIVQKVQIGKSHFLSPWEITFESNFGENDVRVLPILLSHALRLEGIPLHHRDPCDRMLVAQCLEENIPIISADPSAAPLFA